MKYGKLILIFIFCILFLTGCYDSAGIETKAYVVALGIDKVETDTIKLSLQIAILKDSESSAESSTIVSVDCSSIDSGINLINSYLSKQIDLTHCKAIILSEELAYDGVSDYIFTLVNNIQIRPGCNIIISQCDAFEFLKNAKPVFESIEANYYELILNSSEYTAYIADLRVSDFYSNILSNASEATAILGGVNTKETHDNNTSPSYSLDGDYTATEVPIEGTNNVVNLGLAVFYGDRLVGELNNVETLCHLIITNKLENATITIPSPFEDDTNISLYIHLNKNTENEVEFINNFPFIKCKIYITAHMLYLDETLDLLDGETLNTLNSYVDSYLEQNITNYLYKTSKEFKSDIANFGKYVLPKYLETEDWENSDWLNNYQNSFFSVDVETHIQSGSLFNKF